MSWTCADNIIRPPPIPPEKQEHFHQAHRDYNHLQAGHSSLRYSVARFRGPNCPWFCNLRYAAACPSR